MSDIYENVIEKLKTHPVSVDSMDDWIFITINTMKAIVDNSNKEEIAVVLKATFAKDTAEIQRFYDMIQGRFGRDGFSYRNSPSYYYLSSLVARFPEQLLSDEDREKINTYYVEERYLLYEI